VCNVQDVHHAKYEGQARAHQKKEHAIRQAMEKLDDKSFHPSFLSSENFGDELYLIYFPLECQVPMLG
jgi:hypothetical protein